MTCFCLSTAFRAAFRFVSLRTISGQTSLRQNPLEKQKGTAECFYTSLCLLVSFTKIGVFLQYSQARQILFSAFLSSLKSSRYGFFSLVDDFAHYPQEFVVHLRSSDTHAVHLDRRANQDFLLGELFLNFRVQNSRNFEEDKIRLAFINASAKRFQLRSDFHALNVVHLRDFLDEFLVFNRLRRHHLAQEADVPCRSRL